MLKSFFLLVISVVNYSQFPMFLDILGQVVLKLTHLTLHPVFTHQQDLLLRIAFFRNSSLQMKTTLAALCSIFYVLWYLAVMVAKSSPFASLVNKNMPAVAGGLRWAQELQQRIQAPFSKLRHLSYPWVSSLTPSRADGHPSSGIIAPRDALNVSWTDAFVIAVPREGFG